MIVCDNPGDEVGSWALDRTSSKRIRRGPLGGVLIDPGEEASAPAAAERDARMKDW
jgi:hypothetical protein